MTREEHAKITARSFTTFGIECLIRDAKRQLAELDKLDAAFGDAGREARAEGRTLYTERLAVAERALEIHKNG